VATTREIKNRINSVKNTQKITSAMYLISSTKLQKAKGELERTRPYFTQIENEIKRIFQDVHQISSEYFYPETGRKPAETYAYLVITADKGLAGGYNHNVLKLAEEEMRRHKKVQLYVVGEFGRHYFMKHNIPIARSFLYTAQNPTFHRAREICSLLLTEYEEKRVDEIRVIYSDMQNELVCDVKKDRILPLERRNFSADEVQNTTYFRFDPSAEQVLANIMHSYISGYIYGALVSSFCAEQNARMTAMDSSNKNAEELLAKLSVEYNRVRQAAITQEITEVAAGARAQRIKKKKENT